MSDTRNELSFYSDQNILDEVRRRNLDGWGTIHARIKAFAESLIGLHESEARERVEDAGLSDVSIDTDPNSWVVCVRISVPAVWGGSST